MPTHVALAGYALLAAIATIFIFCAWVRKVSGDAIAGLTLRRRHGRRHHKFPLELMHDFQVSLPNAHLAVVHERKAPKSPALSAVAISSTSSAASS